MTVMDSVRTLGVYMYLVLTWKTQFEVMRKKLHTSITKLMATDMNAHQAAVYYNVCMIKSVFFGCGVITISESQEKELKRLYKEPLLMKLRLSRNFPRVVLYSRKSALGVGIMVPLTIISLLKAKLYLSNIRVKCTTYQAISVQEEYQQIKAGWNIHVGYNPSDRYWKSIWVDEVNDLFYNRNISIAVDAISETEKSFTTLMDYAVEYTDTNALDPKILKIINFMRLKKGI